MWLEHEKKSFKSLRSFLTPSLQTSTPKSFIEKADTNKNAIIKMLKSNIYDLLAHSPANTSHIHEQDIQRMSCVVCL